MVRARLHPQAYNAIRNVDSIHHYDLISEAVVLAFSHGHTTIYLDTLQMADLMLEMRLHLMCE
jgi:hypothetical protein